MAVSGRLMSRTVNKGHGLFSVHENATFDNYSTVRLGPPCDPGESSSRDLDNPAPNVEPRIIPRPAHVAPNQTSRSARIRQCTRHFAAHRSA